jgi:aspartate/methionine/tyrosine aminotransferase
VTDKCRAIVVVNPNNPTGNYLKRSELEEMTRLDVPIISDEVFSAFLLLEDSSRVTTILSAQGPLVFALGGLSKMLALPQVKLSWIAVDGPTHRVQDALTRIDLIADTFLSVSTAAQIAVPSLLAQRSLIQQRIFERLEGALETLHRILADSPATVLRVEGGWSAVVRLPNTRPELDWVLTLLEEDRVLVHPGWFYDFASEPFVVLSLMTPPAMFSEGVSRLERRVRAFA